MLVCYSNLLKFVFYVVNSMFIQSILLLILKILYKKLVLLISTEYFTFEKYEIYFLPVNFYLKSSIYYNISLLTNALYVSLKKLIFFCGKFLSNIDVTNIDVTSKC